MSTAFAARLNGILTESGLAAVTEAESAKFAVYLTLLERWNQRMNLTAIRDEEGILRRHFAESIACARALPTGIATLLDFGSGGGFPGIPIAICRPDIEVTLAESQAKKAAFLREAVRATGISATVHGGRADELKRQFDGVAMRAVDKMAQAVQAATTLVKPEGWLVLMTTATELDGLKDAAGIEFRWKTQSSMLGGDGRLIAFGRLRGSAAQG
jgi:16S rRNA (guanine527-N7)-methyltransferase